MRYDSIYYENGKKRHRVIHIDWFQEKRLEHIDLSLQVTGYLNREDIETTFNVSTVTASTTIALYLSINPNSMCYDKKKKRYVVSDKFNPLFKLSADETGVLKKIFKMDN